MHVSPVKLELGCGVNPLDGYLHHDRTFHGPWVDEAHDLNDLPWPWWNEHFDEIVAHDVMEHLKLDVSQWLDELWRILKPDGDLYLRVPSWDNPVSYRDPTHQRVFHEETFDYWDPSKDLYHNYGKFYFDGSNKWWKVESVKRDNPDPRYGVGDLSFHLIKIEAR